MRWIAVSFEDTVHIWQPQYQRSTSVFKYLIVKNVSINLQARRIISSASLSVRASSCSLTVPGYTNIGYLPFPYSERPGPCSVCY